VRVLRGDASDGTGRRFAIVASRFNSAVTEKLVDGAHSCLVSKGVSDDDITVVLVPGAFEIPLAAQEVAESGLYDAVICLGAVIRGQTSHADLVSREAARGIADVGRVTKVPCIFEVLATEDLAQAEARAGGSHGNRGWDAAEAALEMASVLDAIGKGEADDR
jgi:6,7-dimethyl-8-ribityllumazine synthase